MVWFDAVRPYLLCGFVALYLAMIWEVVFVYKVGMLHEGVCFVHHTTIFLYTSFGYLILPRYIYIYTNTSTQPSNHPTKQQHKMPTPSKTTDSEHARLQNDYGADYWVRNSAQQHRVRIPLPLPLPLPLYTMHHPLLVSIN